jgi:hypothetical protein
MNFKWAFHPVAEFHDFEDAWRSINLSDASSPVLDPAFVAPLLHEFATGSEKLAVCKRDESIVAMAILVKKNFVVWETFQPSQAPIGLWLNSPDVSLMELLHTLLDALPGYPMLLALSQRDPELWSRPSDEGHVRTLDYVETGIIVLEDSYQSYWSSLEGQLRKSINRRLRQIAEQGLEIRLEMILDSAVVADAVAEFGSLESSGWKGKQGTAIHGDNSQGRFYTAVLQTFCRRGKGCIYRYWLGDKVAAMQLAIEEGGVVVFLKTTFDENFRAFGPGILLKRAIVEFLYGKEPGCRIELYGKLRDYQAKWVTASKQMYHVNYYRWPIMDKFLAWARSMAGRRMQQEPERQD